MTQKRVPNLGEGAECEGRGLGSPPGFMEGKDKFFGDGELKETQGLKPLWFQDWEEWGS